MKQGMKHELAVALESAETASKALMNAYHEAKDVSREKAPGNLQLVMDMVCEERVLGTLQKAFPDHGIISEECGRIDRESDYTWIVDPIDGTHNYYFGLPMFGVSIALQHKRKIVLGVLSFPYFNQTLHAVRGRGAFLASQRLKVSGTRELERAIMLYDSGFHRKRAEMLDCFPRLMDQVFSSRILGSTVTDFGLIAKGKADFCVEHSCMPWDIAAGALIVEEAGGKVTDFKGKHWKLESGNLVASNGLLHKKVLSLLQSHG